MPTAAVDDPQVFPLFGQEGRIALHQLGETQNGVQGRANLVRHIRQEHALGPVGGFRRVFGLSQCFFRPLALGNILNDGNEVFRFAGSVTH